MCVGCCVYGTIEINGAGKGVSLCEDRVVEDSIKGNTSFVELYDDLLEPDVESGVLVDQLAVVCLEVERIICPAGQWTNVITVEEIIRDFKLDLAVISQGLRADNVELILGLLVDGHLGNTKG